MPIRKPDIRELKTKVELKVIYNQNRGDANGDYAIFDIAPDAQNLRPGNYDTINNNPNITFGTLSLLKRSTRVKTATSVQNGKMLEVNANPSASSCTFAYGAIGNDQAYPRNELGAQQANNNITTVNGVRVQLRLNYDVMLQNNIIPHGYKYNHHPFANLLKGPSANDPDPLVYDYTYWARDRVNIPNPPLWDFTYARDPTTTNQPQNPDITGFNPVAPYFYEINTNSSLVPRVDGEIYRTLVVGNNLTLTGPRPYKRSGVYVVDWFETKLFDLLQTDIKANPNPLHNSLRKITTYNIWNVYTILNDGTEVPGNIMNRRSDLDRYIPGTTNYSQGTYDKGVLPNGQTKHATPFIPVRLGYGPYTIDELTSIDTNFIFDYPTNNQPKVLPKAKIYSIYDNTEGVLMFVDCTGTSTEGIIKRVYPVSKDAIYNQNAPYIFPTYTPATNFTSLDERRPWSEAVYNSPAVVGNTNFAYDEIKSIGGDNCGFHIRLSGITMNTLDSRIRIELNDESTTKKNDTIFGLSITLIPDQVPVIEYKYYKSSTSNGLNYKEFKRTLTDVKLPIFDHRNLKGTDIFVHFVGSVIMIGFDQQINTWISINPEESGSTVIEPFFSKNNTYIKLNVLSCSFKMRYSAIMFRNIDFTNGFIDLGATSPTKNKYVQNSYILADFTSSPDKTANLSAANLLSTFTNNKYLGKNATVYNTLQDKVVSYFGDWRNPNTRANSDFTYTEIYDSTTIYQSYVRRAGKLFYNNYIESPLYLAFEAGNNNLSPPELLQPILNGNISPYITNWTVRVQSENPNFSQISKTGTINLVNLDTDAYGLRVLELLEHNIIAVSVSAGYGDVFESYFDGVITNVSTTRKGSGSSTILSVQDLTTYIFDNVYFDYMVPFGTRTLKTAIQACMNFSGFSDWYKIETNAELLPADRKETGKIDGLTLRINPNASSNQDVIKATPVDKILPKLSGFLNKLNALGNQATFRWDEKQKLFILDARYMHLDDDLKFTGIDNVVPGTTSGQRINVKPTRNISTPDWHGLITESFVIDTNLDSLAYGVNTYGITSGVIGSVSYETDEQFHVASLSLAAKNNIVNSLINTTSVSAGYVGFRKFIKDSYEQNELPSDQLVKFKHDQNVKIIRTPFHSLQFSCYVTKPLKAHGTFVVKVFVDNSAINPVYNITDKYIYKSIDYNYIKSTNLITASITGFAQPWTIAELARKNDS
jgi:hypothetical protein